MDVSQQNLSRSVSQRDAETIDRLLRPAKANGRSTFARNAKPQSGWQARNGDGLWIGTVAVTVRVAVIAPGNR
jgi:hypothetical protein